MILWRISNHATLDGAGGLRASGRWHTRGLPVVYCGANPGTALLEIIVHARIRIEDVPSGLRYLEIDVPDKIAVHDADVAKLGSDWHQKLAATRAIGDEWLRSARSAVLRAPSVIVPATWNFLINPRHADSAGIQILKTHHHRLDPRVIRR